MAKQRFIVGILIIFSCIFLYGDEIYHNSFGYYVDLPAGWTVLDATEPAAISFTDENRNVVFQVYTFASGKFDTARDIMGFIKERLKAEGEGADFRFNAHEAVLADLTFASKTFKARGYYGFIKGNEYDFAVMAYTSVKFYNDYHDLLISCLNSFAPNTVERYTPGIISQFYYPLNTSVPQSVTLSIDGKQVKTNIDKNQIEATEITIEREAIILSYYPDVTDELFIKAWRRYYRMIYKDNYTRFDTVAADIYKHLNLKDKNETEIARSLLSWLQGYKYHRINKLSDFTPPILSLLTSSGDCDSLAILYCILLHHYNIDSILFVSQVYKHALAGVAVPYKGAKIPFNNKQYLVAELTANVDIGQIDREQAVTDNWIPIGLGKFNVN